MRIAVFGSSTVLNIRPPRRDRSEGTYADWLRIAVQLIDPTSEVFNLARRSNMVIHETEMVFAGALQSLNPDVAILHFGINESSPRAIPFGLWMWLHGPQDCGRLKAVLSGVLLRVWAVLIRLFHLGGWVGPDQFGNHLVRLITHVKKECQAVVFVITIGPPNAHYCKLLPRIESIIPKYNAVSEEVARAYDAVLVDIGSMVQAEGLERAQPDGCHLSAYGHRRVFEMIWNELMARGLVSTDAGRRATELLARGGSLRREAGEGAFLEKGRS